MIQDIKNAIDLPLFIGGGIRSIEQALATANAGADVVVVGNAFEKNPDLILTISNAIHGVASAN